MYRLRRPLLPAALVVEVPERAAADRTGFLVPLSLIPSFSCGKSTVVR